MEQRTFSFVKNSEIFIDTQNAFVVVCDYVTSEGKDMKKYIYECRRCGKQMKTDKKPKGDKVCTRCGEIVGGKEANGR